jgi:tripartite ATP-independent transporter DctP family solute receptor
VTRELPGFESGQWRAAGPERPGATRKASAEHGENCEDDQPVSEQSARQRFGHDFAAPLRRPGNGDDAQHGAFDPDSGGVAGVGYAFKDYNQVWAAADGELGNYIGKAIQKVGLVPFQAMWDNGFRQITSSTRPIKTPDDLKGFKIRVPVVQLWVQMFAAFGAAPTTIPLSEAYSALQTKIADGQENPLVLIEAAKFYEVQKYCSLTNHVWDGHWACCNAAAWKGLPDDLKAIVARNLNEAAKREREDIAANDKVVQADLEKTGLVFNAAETQSFRDGLK